MNPIYATYQDDNKISEILFDSIADYNSFFWSPQCMPLETIELKATGKTYQQKKQSVRDVILDITAVEYEINGIGLSYGEMQTLQGWCEDMAKRYGLTKEFQENAII